MNRTHMQPGSLATAATALLVFVAVTVGIVIGGFTLALLALSSIIKSVLGRGTAHDTVDLDSGNGTGVVIEGRYEVVDESTDRHIRD